MHSETDRQTDSDRETEIERQRQKVKGREGEVAHFLHIFGGLGVAAAELFKKMYKMK